MVDTIYKNGWYNSFANHKKISEYIYKSFNDLVTYFFCTYSSSTIMSK